MVDRSGDAAQRSREKASKGLSPVAAGIEPRGVERLFEAVANYTYDWESWMSPDGRPLWINPAVERMTGYTVEECLALPDYPLPLVHEEDRPSIMDHLRAAAAGHSGNDVAFRIRQKNGLIRWAAMSWQTLYDDSGRSLGYRTSMRDITGRKQVEDALRRAHAEAERANRAKSRFLAAASHDLRQPLQAINLFVAALKAGLRDPESVEIVESIQESLRATEDLLDALLDVSRLEAGVLQPRLRDVAIVDLTDRLETEFASQAAAKGLTLRTVASSAVVRTDPALLDRILRNLLSNALRYTECGGVLLGCRRRGGHISVEVWDTGIGIPDDKREAIFEEFYQLGNPERDRTRGLGLGLAIVDRIARLLGHTVTLRSQPGRGSVFAIQVPLVSGRPDPVPARAEGSDPDRSGALSGALVVAIEDEPMQLRGLERLLCSWGCKVVPSQSTAEALTQLVELKQVPDVILADYRLRGEMNGVQAIMTLRAGLGRMIPGIILTGDTEPGRMREANANGFELLHKPIDADRLFTALASVTPRAAPAPS